MFILILSFLMSFTLVYSISPAAINIAVKKSLTADPGDRHSHEKSTPCIGGIPIFMGVVFTVLLLTPVGRWETLQFILGALLLVFMLGTKDDITEMSAWKKMMGLLFAIIIVVTRGEIRLESLYGLGYYHGAFPEWASMIVSAFTLLVITNAFNLIDGIDGLAGTLGCIIMITFGTWFFVAGVPYLSVIALATAGSLLAFLRFNLTPARTFMGDSGALVVGLLIGVLSIEFIDRCATMPLESAYRFQQPVAIAVAVLVIPLFDTIRVFCTRLIRGQSPFLPDRRHIHHLLIDTGRSHVEATAILALVNLLIISSAFALDGLVDLHLFLGLEIAVALILTYWLHRAALRARKAKQETGVAALELA